MDITTNNDWTDVGNDYKIQYATTSDPRIVAVIERDEEYGGGHIDGDAYAPAFYWDRVWGQIDGEAGSTFVGDARRILERIIDARAHFQHKNMPWATVERYARVYHGTTMVQVSSSIDRDAQVVILNTPEWREHIGFTGDAFDPEVLKGNEADWTAALDGDVYGIGYAVYEARVTDEEDIDLEDGNWDIQILCGGELGEDYAKRTASDFTVGTPSNLHPLLDFA
jgi:hypothetical protein